MALYNLMRRRGRHDAIATVPLLAGNVRVYILLPQLSANIKRN